MDKPIESPYIMLEVRLPQMRSDGDSRSAYDVLYSETDISQRESFYLWLSELLDFKPGEVYLDISCGRAQLVVLAHQKGAIAYGIDLSHTVLKMSRSLINQKRLVTANSQVLPYASNSFDVISNIGSLEHYVDMRAAVHEMMRVLKPDGRAYILVPNTFSLLTNVWIAFRQGRTSIDQQPIQRYAARLEWQQLLEESGLTIQEVRKYEREWPRTGADLLYYLRHPKALIRLLLTPFIPLNLAFCFVFIARKLEEQA